MKYVHHRAETCTSSVAGIDLYTADKEITLIRIIVDMQLVYTSNTAGFCDNHFQIEVRPNGQSVCDDPTIGDQDYGQVPDEQLLNWPLSVGGDQDAGASRVNSYFVDSKGQRKLSKDDKLSIYHVGSGATAAWKAVFTLFFKEY